MIGGEDGIPSKPDPAGALEISKRLKISPSEFIFLGDSGVDMKTANVAGMSSVAALWGFRSREELERDGAKVLIDRPEDLLRLLD